MRWSPLPLSIATALIAACTATTPSTPSAAPATTQPTASPAAWPDGLQVSESGQYAIGDHDVPGFLAYVPPGHDDDSPLPVLVFLHGAGESGTGTEADLRKVLKLGIPRLIADGDWPAEHPFLVLMPQYPQADAEGECALADEISTLLQHANLTYRVDRQRIYLTGISCGAIGIWDYLAEVEDSWVAAAVPIAGHPVWAFEKAGCEVARAPIWAFHGADDEVVPVQYVEDAFEEMRSCTDPPPELQLTIYPDADHFEDDAWSRTYDLSAGHDIFSWLLEHRVDD